MSSQDFTHKNSILKRLETEDNQDFGDDDYEAAFKMFDQMRRGFITFQEFALVLKYLNQEMTEEELQALFLEADTEISGTLSKDEFVEFLKRKIAARDPEEDIMTAFMSIDRSGDGTISKDELMLVNGQLDNHFPEEMIDKMIKYADRNGSGKISYDDFRNMILNDARRE